MKFLTSDLEDISWVQHGFFTRLGGVSSGVYTSLNCGLKTADKLTNILANRSRVSEVMGILPEHLMIAKQVHGAQVVHVEKPWKFGNAPEGDAMVTAEKGIGLGIITADCVPVLLASKKDRIIGAAHVGWKGAFGDTLESTVEAMKKIGAAPETIHVALGPCIGAHSYEVRDDFKIQFLEQDRSNERFFKEAPRQGHLLFNLPGYVAEKLYALGVTSVHDICQDTLMNETSFFSHRRAFLKSEKDFGSQLSVIVIK
ncbi:MAG: peptidoglycan editing factor PgeF [Alphaproteobacteria bacterium]|nr:peptidoglycan editing factor PgeF [Alphaproteobacteria bacterium]MCK5555576.1 peptidoglycan editing factor PgeF [Alphaproteobacteria bacterium]